MRKKSFLAAEFFGSFAVLFITLLMSKIYAAADGNVLGVLFGSANSSAWELAKLSSLAYISVGAAQLILFRPPVAGFTFAKAVGVLILTALLSSAYYFGGMIAVCPAAVLLCSAAGYLVSALLTVFTKVDNALLLPSALALLFTVIALFCFTAAPPHLPLFLDRVSGLYGVIPCFG